MLQRLKMLKSENHIGEDIGDAPAIVRADFEDAMVQALDDTYTDGKLDAFRAFVTKYRREWPPDYYEWIVSQDYWAQFTVYYLTCFLRRMMPRWEHAANKLKDQFGLDPSEIPPGNEWLYR